MTYYISVRCYTTGQEVQTYWLQESNLEVEIPGVGGLLLPTP